MIINDELIEPLIQESIKKQRKRTNYNFHKVAGDTMQRMLNVIQPGSYIRPHKHESPDKREVFIIIRGCLLVVLFNDQGGVRETVVLDSATGVYGYEVKPAVYHSIIALEDDTVVYELKDGPYNPADDKQFATWAPAETNEKEAGEYLNSLKKAISR